MPTRFPASRGPPLLAKPGGPPYDSIVGRRKSMNIQYVTDEQGQKLAVMVPIHDWEALLVKNLEYADDVTPEEIVEAEAAWADIQANPEKAEPIEQVMKELLDDRTE